MKASSNLNILILFSIIVGVCLFIAFGLGKNKTYDIQIHTFYFATAKLEIASFSLILFTIFSLSYKLVAEYIYEGLAFAHILLSIPMFVMLLITSQYIDDTPTRYYSSTEFKPTFIHNNFPVLTSVTMLVFGISQILYIINIAIFSFKFFKK